jgi:hypothetical protein
MEKLSSDKSQEDKSKQALPARAHKKKEVRSLELDLGKDGYVDAAVETRPNYGNRAQKFDAWWKTRHRIYLQLLKNKNHITHYDGLIKKNVNKTLLSIKDNIFQEVIGPLQGIPQDRSNESYLTKEIFLKAILTKLLTKKKKQCADCLSSPPKPQTPAPNRHQSLTHNPSPKAIKITKNPMERLLTLNEGKSPEKDPKKGKIMGNEIPNPNRTFLGANCSKCGDLDQGTKFQKNPLAKFFVQRGLGEKEAHDVGMRGGGEKAHESLNSTKGEKEYFDLMTYKLARIHDWIYDYTL